MFDLTDQPIVVPDLQSGEAGGVVIFDGRVRNHNDGRRVKRLEYEAYSELAEKQGRKLVQEAIDRFSLVWAKAIHRTGMLETGECAVWIGCGAAHRKSAFEACEFIIDEIKVRLPIWKREHYFDGPSEWINLEEKPSIEVDSSRFARQIAIPEVGANGQSALSRAKILMVGAGGLGCAALPYLAGAGVGTIGIVDPDRVEASNLSRQILFSPTQTGESKARLAASAVRRINPGIQVLEFAERLTEENASQIVENFDVVIDGTDRFDAKFLLNDICQTLSKPLIQASIHRFDGYVQTILPGGPCLRCLWPDPPEDGCVETCAEAGVIGTTPGTFGILQANEALKLVLGIEPFLSQHQFFLDLRDMTSTRIKRLARVDCPSCKLGSWTWSRQDPLEILPEHVANSNEPWVCIDIRESFEQRNRIELGQVNWLQSPMSQFQIGSLASLPNKNLLVCAHGIRSAQLAFELRQAGFENVYSLIGGAS
ncbi:MAG TPA: ThiF family adenylyltransferase [Fimbriimonadaceae bacterium]|nr:ThiF family adenylyltransferase [Fimbriimonadaceae bacterium]